MADDLTDLRSGIAAMRRENADNIAAMRRENADNIAAIQRENADIRARVDGLPLLAKAVDVLQRDTRQVRDDITVLLERKPHAGMDLLTTLGRQFHAAQQLVRIRAMRNPNEIIEQKATWGERVADSVAHFGGSWTFIILFIVAMSIYACINILLRGRAWDPYPFILLNLFLSMLAAIQAPVIMMSQNRQDTKDRLRGELDYDVNRRAESEIQGLARKLNLLDEKIDDIANIVRKPVQSNLHS